MENDGPHHMSLRRVKGVLHMILYDMLSIPIGGAETSRPNPAILALLS